MSAIRFIIGFLKLGFAATAFTGLAMEFYLTIIHHEGIVNFFSYFTTIGNIFVPIVLGTSAVVLLLGRKPTPLLNFFRGMAVLIMTIIGIVYVVLLAGVQASEIPWVNTFHHYIMPVVLIVDWIVQPPSSKLSPKAVLLWFILPVVYLAYTLIRGVFTNFYPYGFLNPHVQHGYGGVAIYCVVMLVAFLAFGFIFMLMGNFLSKLRLYRRLYGTSF